MKSSRRRPLHAIQLRNLFHHLVGSGEKRTHGSTPRKCAPPCCMNTSFGSLWIRPEQGPADLVASHKPRSQIVERGRRQPRPWAMGV
jgi:hypothetical protein